ncbi:3'-5' exoribonuclease 1 [Cichlidogyrus casuarinus]|uniref:3'-5' exoribonuclease 1 n=1 Tax=Cichlidogyrus casuarinus TaxID=1844966 RepID=A0ABD2Q4Z3_9PLAT
MSNDQLRYFCYEHSLDPNGTSVVLKKRLQHFLLRYRHKYTDKNSMFPTGTPPKMDQSAISSRPFDFIPLDNEADSVIIEPSYENRYLLIIDLECTCESQGSHRNGGVDYDHEIIEFPILLYDSDKQSVISIFHAFCKPVKNPKLTNFCTNLTGITEERLEDALTFPELFLKIEHWIYNECGLKDDQFIVVCDCNADMGKFMRIQCHISRMDMPSWSKKWCNLSRHFCEFYAIPKKRVMPLGDMIRHLEIPFFGSQHRALDDCTNILRVMETLLRDGCKIRKDEQYCNQRPHFCCPIPKNLPKPSLEEEKPEITDADREQLLSLLNMKKARVVV